MCSLSLQMEANVAVKSFFFSYLTTQMTLEVCIHTHIHILVAVATSQGATCSSIEVMILSQSDTEDTVHDHLCLSHPQDVQEQHTADLRTVWSVDWTYDGCSQSRCESITLSNIVANFWKNVIYDVADSELTSTLNVQLFSSTLFDTWKHSTS